MGRSRSRRMRFSGAASYRLHSGYGSVGSPETKDTAKLLSNEEFVARMPAKERCHLFGILYKRAVRGSTGNPNIPTYKSELAKCPEIYSEYMKKIDASARLPPPKFVGPEEYLAQMPAEERCHIFGIQYEKAILRRSGNPNTATYKSELAKCPEIFAEYMKRINAAKAKVCKANL